MLSVFFLGHNGLGDNITNIGAINYLLTIYENIYFICKDIYIQNLKQIYTDPRIFLVPFKSNNETDARFKLLIPRYTQNNMDILISGDCHKSNFKSKPFHSMPAGVTLAPGTPSGTWEKKTPKATWCSSGRAKTRPMLALWPTARPWACAGIRPATTCAMTALAMPLRRKAPLHGIRALC